MPATANQIAPPTSKRRWFQYGLRSLFIFMTVAGCGLGWLGIHAQRAKRQHDAAEAIKKRGGRAFYDFQLGPKDKEIQNAAPPGPAWLRDTLGNDLFDDVVMVAVGDDEQLGQLKDLPRLTSVRFYCTKHITNDGLANLRDAPQLRTLMMAANDNITDAGLVQLQALTQLRQLSMRYLKTTDAALENVKHMSQLEELTLGSTITDAGLEHLMGLTHLQLLELNAAKVTKEAVAKLQAALPNCKIRHRGE